MGNDHCTHMRDLMTEQIPAIEQAVKRNEYFLGQIAGHYIGEDKAKEDFFTHHLRPYFGKIFKSLFCTYKCPDGQTCEIAKSQYQALARPFKEEIEELGIDSVLAGGEATEAIFKKFQERTNSEGV